MTKLQKRISTAIATGSLLLMQVMPAFAATELVITGNGSDSNNTVNVGQSSTTSVTQNNSTSIDNNIHVNADTGSNTAKDNTNGDVTVDTGDATATVTVANVANSNTAEVQPCNCADDATVTIEGNGSGSRNNADLQKGSSTAVYQTNVANIDNKVDANAKTGGNRVEDNTGGNVELLTGNAQVTVDVANIANVNTASVMPSGQGGTTSVLIKDNGSDSRNSVKLGLGNSVLLTQDNLTSIDNDIEADAKTGWNTADDNTGGMVTIDTGDAIVNATVDNMAGFNTANVDECCFDSVLAKLAGNGEDSRNLISAELGSNLGVWQDNSCGMQMYPVPTIYDFMQLRTPRHMSHDCFNNNLDLTAMTGDNRNSDNTDGMYDDPSVYTGDSHATVGVQNNGGSNVFGAASEAPAMDWSMPGFGFGLNISLNFSDILAWLNSQV